MFESPINVYVDLHGFVENIVIDEGKDGERTGDGGERQTDRQTDRQTETEREAETEIETQRQ